MEYYQEEPSEIMHFVDPDPFQGIVKNYTRLYVTHGKRLMKLVKHAMKQFGPGQPVIWSAEGRHTSKAVECVELMKAKADFKEIYQVTRLGEIRTTEVWNPLDEDDGLDPLQVTRSVPIIHIVLSVEPPDSSLTGSQLHKANTPPLNILESSILPRPESPPHSPAPVPGPSSPIPIPVSPVTPTLSSSI